MLSYNQCYHGTSKERFLSIRRCKKFKFKRRTNHWLGQGIYFFVEDKSKAQWFACSNPNLRGSVKCVIKVKIKVDEQVFLNLDTEKGRNSLEAFAEQLQNLSIKLTPQSDNATCRCLIIDAFIKYHNIKAVKYTFADDKLTYKALNLENDFQNRIRNTGIQINVIDQSIIDFKSLSVTYI
ncbi:hypothetical protein ACFQ22_02010 [Lentilactobacillus raoultii]|uniref:Uncharacterized protein n=1 Tax=Lentilactobacillus raoultii TaxID=1987503 RepID=A0ABW3PIT0_9LACO|nr:hypothetical protein [Lentilactobacillus raoultii]